MSHDADADHNKLVAKLVAHERLLGLLLSLHLKELSAPQRRVLEAILSQPAGLPEMGSEFDIGTADDIAGLAIDYADAIHRVFRLALSTADNRTG